MTWFQVAHDSEAEHDRWVVLQMYRYGPLGRDVHSREHSRWPTRHEAEGHARKAWENLR